MRNLWLHIVFVVIIIGDLTSSILGVKWMDYTFKPLILLWIASYFILNAKNVPISIRKLILPAFIFSWAGDVLLMLTHINPMFFIVGLVSFLTAHIFYIFLYLKTITLSGKKSFLQKRAYWIIVYIIYGLLIYIVLYNHLDNVMKIAVFVYMVALLSMAAMALNRLGNGHPLSYTLIMIGTLLFVISDTLIAFNKFVAPIFMERILVMSTYISAQYLIMRGVLKQFE